jgi:hypothetical protein
VMLLQQVQSNGGTDWWVTFGAALGGALAGGIASAIGSVWVNRTELTRTRRINLYEGGLEVYRARAFAAALRNQFGQPIDPTELSLELDPVMRAATVAGRRDRRQVETLRQTVKSIVPLESTSDRRLDPTDPQYDAAYCNSIVEKQSPMTAKLAEQVGHYDAWLAKKVR